MSASQYVKDEYKEDIIKIYPSAIKHRNFGEATEKIYEQAITQDEKLIEDLFEKVSPKFTASIVANNEDNFKRLFRWHMTINKVVFDMLSECLKVNSKSIRWIEPEMLHKFNKDQLFEITLMM